MIDQFFANESRLMFDTDAIRCEKAEAIALANELRALLADRDRLAGEVTEWEGHAQTYEAGMVAARRELAALKAPAPRRLREYKGVVYRENAWETPDGKRYEMASGVVWNKSVTLSLTDLDIPALLALRDDPEYPVETLEEVIHAWSNAGPLLSNYRIDDLCYRLRAWLTTQPQPVSVPYTLPITPEQAVRVLVEKGAKRSSAKHAAKDSYEYAPVLILPTATPEPTP
jgi:hypothetical protein